MYSTSSLNYLASRHVLLPLPDRCATETIEVISLGTAFRRIFFQPPPISQTLLVVAIALFVAASYATAQSPVTVAQSNIPATNPSLNLPDSPGFLASSSADATAPDENPDDLGDQQAVSSTSQQSGIRTRHIGRLRMTIAPNEIAEPMSVDTKVVAGLKNSVSFFSATGWVASAGWTQLTNGSPNYGTDRGAFGQRLGAAALRNISESIFTDALFAPVFHEDARYYVLGKGHRFFRRVVYAATRAVITRTDSGRTTPNFALLAGNAAGAALTVTYYPAKNTTFSEVAQTFGGSVGGSALGFGITEFLGDALEFVHLKKQ
jgi:hypothetical protein